MSVNLNHIGLFGKVSDFIAASPIIMHCEIGGGTMSNANVTYNSPTQIDINFNQSRTLYIYGIK